MAQRRICPHCGEPLDPRAAAVTGAVRCPSCSETIPAAEAAPSPTPRSPRTAPAAAGQVTEEAARSALRRRLAAVSTGLDHLPSPSPELVSLRQVVAGINDEITSGCGPHGEKLDYLALAQQLSFAPRLLRRHELDQLADELDRIRVTLERLATVAPPVPTKPPAAEEPERAVESADDDEPPSFGVSSASRAGGNDAPAPGRSTTLLILAAMAIVVVAAGTWLLLGRREAPPPPAAAPTATPVQVAGAPTPAPTVAGPDLDRFLDHLARARQAVLSAAPVDAVTELLAAAAISRERKALFDTARETLRALVVDAGEAMDGGRWGDADRLLAAAIELASELDLSTTALEKVVTRLTASPWTTTLHRPTAADLEPLAGRRITLVATTGGRAQGVLEAVTATTITVAVEQTFDGGNLTVDTELALADIDRVTWDAPIDARLTQEAMQRARERRARSPLAPTTPTPDP